MCVELDGVSGWVDKLWMWRGGGDMLFEREGERKVLIKVGMERKREKIETNGKQEEKEERIFYKWVEKRKRKNKRKEERGMCVGLG